MARQTTKKKVETPENPLEAIAHEHGIDAMRAEIERLNGVIRHQELVINGLQKANEQISDELSKERFNK